MGSLLDVIKFEQSGGDPGILITVVVAAAIWPDGENQCSENESRIANRRHYITR